jgi:hypothetical protein
MKKLGVIFAIIALVTAFAVIGCGTGGGGKLERYQADLTKFQTIKNTAAFTKIYDGFAVPFPEFDVDITQFRRITVRARCTNAAGDDITAWSHNAQVRLVLDLTPDEGAPARGGYNDLHSKKPRTNALFYEYNVGFEGLGALSSNEGILMGLGGRVPAGIYVDCSSDQVKFIEITEIIFHNGSAKAPQVGGGTFNEVNLDPFDMVLVANFQYGRTWQNIFRPPHLLNGYRLTAGDEFELTVEYSASRDIPNEIIVTWANSGSTPWVFLTLAEGERDGTVATTRFPASRRGVKVNGTLNYKVARNGGGGAAGNALIFETIGTPAEGPVTLSYTKFILKKLN